MAGIRLDRLRLWFTWLRLFLFQRKVHKTSLYFYFIFLAVNLKATSLKTAFSSSALKDSESERHFPLSFFHHEKDVAWLGLQYSYKKMGKNHVWSPYLAHLAQSNFLLPLKGKLRSLPSHGIYFTVNRIKGLIIISPWIWCEGVNLINSLRPA